MDASSLFTGLSRVAGMFDPVSWAVGIAGDCLGMDTKTRNLVRVIAGVVTLQPQTVLGGALGLLGEHLKEKPAQTEYHHATGTANCKPPAGYAASTARPPPAKPPPGQAQPQQQLPCIPHQSPSPVRSILDDPKLSIEEKISRLVDAMMSKLDKDILAQGKKLEGTEGADREKVMRDLQKLMEQRRQMHELASNTSAAFHGMCMTAIQNMRG